VLLIFLIAFVGCWCYTVYCWLVVRANRVGERSAWNDPLSTGNGLNERGRTYRRHYWTSMIVGVATALLALLLYHD
jgi:uncharacterized membrane protein YhaH (DUF805 family)